MMSRGRSEDNRDVPSLEDEAMIRTYNLQRSSEFNVDKHSNHWWLFRAASSTDLQILFRATLNAVGALLFVVGSIGWVANFPLPGTFIFAASNVFCYCITGTWWAISAKASFKKRHIIECAPNEEDPTHPPAMHPGSLHTPAPDIEHRYSPDVVKAFHILVHMEMMGAIWQVSGAVAFTIGCITSLWPHLYLETVLLWLAGSFFFLLQALISQIICESFLGPLLPVLPKFHRVFTLASSQGPRLHYYSCCRKYSICLHRCVPGALLNTMGSLAFTVGSVMLFYPATETLGAYGYLVGSLMFAISAMADINGFLDALAVRLLTMHDPALVLELAD